MRKKKIFILRGYPVVLQKSIEPILNNNKKLVAVLCALLKINCKNLSAFTIEGRYFAPSMEGSCTLKKNGP